MYKKALIISFSGIGDAVLTEVLCENLKRLNIDMEIDFVVKDNAAPLFINNEAISNVIAYKNDDRKSFLKYIFKTWEITRKKYDIILDVESTVRTELFSLFSLKSKFRIGKDKISKYKLLGFNLKRGWFYTHKIKEEKNNYTIIESLIQFLSPIVDLTKIDYTKEYKVNITDEEKREGIKIIKEAGIDTSKKIIVCNVNAVFEWKRWNKENIVNVLKYILDNYDYQLLFLYTEKEKDYTIGIAKELQKYNEHKKNKIFYNISTNNIREFSKIIINTDMYFGNEGGGRHISQALGIDTVSVCRNYEEKTRWIVENEKHLALVISDFIPIEEIENKNLNWNDMTSEMVISKLKLKLDKLK